MLELDAERAEYEIVLRMDAELWSPGDGEIVAHLAQARLTRVRRSDVEKLRRHPGSGGGGVATTRRFVTPAPPTQRIDRRPPTFSVLIPVYQAASTVGEAIASALAQTVPPHEVIVCDDGSTDDLDGALAPYVQEVTLVRQPNRGAAAARNTALRHATGEFVSILDADDAYLPSRLEALTELGSARPDLDILATDAYFEREGQIVGRFYGARDFPAGDQRRAILEWCFMFNPVVRRSHVLEIGGFDESLRTGEDWDCLLRLILRGARAGLVDEPLVRYRLVRGSLTDDRAESFRDRVRVLERAASNPDLEPGERPMLEDRLTEGRRRALRAEAREALISNSPDARGRALRVLLGSRMTGTQRLKAAFAVASPRVAGRALRRRGTAEKDRFPVIAP